MRWNDTIWEIDDKKDGKIANIFWKFWMKYSKFRPKLTEKNVISIIFSINYKESTKNPREFESKSKKKTETEKKREENRWKPRFLNNKNQRIITSLWKNHISTDETRHISKWFYFSHLKTPFKVCAMWSISILKQKKSLNEPSLMTKLNIWWFVWIILGNCGKLIYIEASIHSKMESIKPTSNS